MGFGLRDKQLNETVALPDDDSAILGAAIEVGNSSRGDFLANVEFHLTAPALTVSQLSDGLSFTYDIVTSDNSDLSASTTLLSSVIVQTGAGGVGAVSANKTVRLPSSGVKQYVGVLITPSADATEATDASAVSATLEVLV